MCVGVCVCECVCERESVRGSEVCRVWVNVIKPEGCAVILPPAPGSPSFQSI